MARKIIGQAVRRTFRRYFPKPDVKVRDGKEGKEGEEEAAESSPYAPVVQWFSNGIPSRPPTTWGTPTMRSDWRQVDGAARAGRGGPEGRLRRRGRPGDEVVLEGLHQHSMISKREPGERHLLSRHAEGDGSIR